MSDLVGNPEDRVGGHMLKTYVMELSDFPTILITKVSNYFDLAQVLP